MLWRQLRAKRVGLPPLRAVQSLHVRGIDLGCFMYRILAVNAITYVVHHHPRGFAQIKVRAAALPRLMGSHATVPATLLAPAGEA